MDSFKNLLKMVLMEKNMTMTQLVELLNKRYERNDSLQNLANKIRKETIRYSEVLEIAEVLDYRILWASKSGSIPKVFFSGSDIQFNENAIPYINKTIEKANTKAQNLDAALDNMRQSKSMDINDFVDVLKVLSEQIDIQRQSIEFLMEEKKTDKDEFDF